MDNRNITLDAGLEGLYRLVVRDARTDEVRRDTGWFKNLILDSGLNRLGTGTAVGYMQIGTGSTAPNVADVALATWAASTSDLQTGFPATANSGSPLYISSNTSKSYSDSCDMILFACASLLTTNSPTISISPVTIWTIVTGKQIGRAHV